MQPIEIKEIQEDQIEASVRMWRRSRDEIQPQIEARMGYGPEDDLNFFVGILMKTCAIWLVLRGDSPVGLLAQNAESIEQLYVDPDQQGLGIGSALIDFAKQQSPTRLRLHTHASNSRARSFYEKHGFRATRFGVSDPPESEPDVQYDWRPSLR